MGTPRDSGDADGPKRLSAARARKFFQHLADHPFMCVVDTDDGLVIYSKDMEAERVEGIKSVLEEDET